MNVGIWDGAAVLVKAVLYAATLGTAGGVFFLAYSRSLLEPSDRLAIARPLCILVAVAIAASVARVLLTAASMSEDAAGMVDTRLLTMVWHGGEGRAAAVRAGGLILALPALACGGRDRWLAIVGAAAAATSFAWVGHARAAAQAATPFLLGVHVLAVAFWLGALGPLAIQTRRREPRQLGAVAARFGRIALGLVGALLAAGTAVLWILLGSISALWTSSYGRLAGRKSRSSPAFSPWRRGTSCVSCRASSRGIRSPRAACAAPYAPRCSWRRSSF